jgi:glycosyltransferase involved in cell wall biosynthesis
VKVLIFHQYFGTSEHSGAGVRTYELGRRLVKRGDVVSIITGNSVYFSGTKLSRSRFPWTRQTVGGIEVLRVHIPFGGSHSLVPRILGFFWFIPLGLLAALCCRRPEVVVATSTPLTIGIPGYLLSRIRRVPFVLELRDLWPDCVVDWRVVRNQLLIRAAYWLESFLYRKSDKILAVTDGIRCQLIRKGISANKISVVTNASDLELFNPNSSQADLQGLGIPAAAFVCIHAGSLGFANSVGFLLDVAEHLRETTIHIVILGAGPQKAGLMKDAGNRKLGNIHFLNPVPKTEVPAYLRRAQLGIAAFRPGRLTHIFLPNKFFDYLACGLPVLVNFDGEARTYLETAGAGIYAAPENPQLCAEKIKELAASRERLSAMAINARRLSENRFSWEHKAIEFREALSSLCLGRPPALAK